MNRLTLLALALLAAASTALAADPAPPSDPAQVMTERRARGLLVRFPGRTAFDRLAAAFREGRRPDVPELRGFRSGRAFRPDRPNRIHPAFLLGRANHARGPLFPDLVVPWYTHRMPNDWPRREDVYDRPEGRAVEAIRWAVESHDFGPLRKGRSCLELDLEGPAGGVAQIVRLRILEGMVLAQAVSAEGDEPARYAYYYRRGPDPLRPPEG